MDKKALADLGIPNFLHDICPNEKTVNHVETYMRAMQQDKSIIVQRQREMADFINNQELMSIMVKHFRRIDELKDRHKKERLTAFKSLSYATHNSKKEQHTQVISNMNLVAKYAEECIKVYHDFPVYVRDLPFESAMFVNLKETLIKITEGEKSKRLMAFLNDFKTLASVDSRYLTKMSVAYKMNDDFTKLSCSISNLLFEFNPTAKKVKLWGNTKESAAKFFKKNEVQRKKDDFTRAEEFFSHTVMSGLNYLIDLLMQFIQFLQKPFEQIQRDLPLYEFAMSLVRHYKTQNMPFCFPKIVNPELEPGEHTYAIGSNNINASALMVFDGGGEADSYQLMQEYVRLQLFAQAGLPVAAEQAQVAIVSDIFVQFASSELVLGRFEEEAKEMSAICQQVKPNGLVFFHDVFQSATYEEVAEPFAQIIEWLVNMPCTVFVVTHNTFLAERLNLCQPVLNEEAKKQN